jgi:hypothetical protein
MSINEPPGVNDSFPNSLEMVDGREVYSNIPDVFKREKA